MPNTHFKPKSGARYGRMITVIGKELSASPFTANNTQTHRMPCPPGKCYLLGASVHALTAGSDADGTLVIRVMRRRASDDVRTQITDDFNLEGLTVRERARLIPTAANADNLRMLNDPGTGVAGDVFEIDCVSNSAVIDAQPTGVTVSLEIAILE